MSKKIKKDQNKHCSKFQNFPLVKHKMKAHIIAFVISALAIALGVYFHVVLIAEGGPLRQFFLASTSGVK